MAIASLLLSQSAPDVSFAADAVTVGALVKDLARQTGRRLEVAPAVASEPLVVQFEGKPLDEVQTRLANLVGATWVGQGGVPTLSRPASQRTDQERQEQRHLAEHWTRMLDLRLGRFDAHSFTSKDADLLVDRYRLAEMEEEALMTEYHRMAGDNPVLRATCRILKTLDPAAVFRLRIGERVVYSDAPTRMQVAMTGKGRAALATLRKEVAEMEAAKKRVGFHPKRKLVNFAGLPVIGPGTTQKGYGKAILALRRYGPLAFRYELTLVAGDGQRLIEADGALPAVVNRYGTKMPTEGHPVEVSESARDLSQLVSRGGGVKMASSQKVDLPGGKSEWAAFWVPFEEDNNDDPARRVRPLLSDPVKHDPIGILAGPLLRQIATRRKLPLLATLGDDALEHLAFQIRGDQLPNEEAVVATLTGTQIAEESRVPTATVALGPDWIEVKPYYPVQARANRFNRQAMGELLASVRKEGVLTMPAAVRYGRPPGRITLAFAYAAFGDAAVGSDEVLGLFNHSMRFLASVQPPQWDALEEPQSLSALSGDQKETVRRWVYESLFSQFRDQAEESGRNPMDPGQRPFELEPTELFPNGLPATARISLVRTEKPLVLTQSSQGLRFSLTPASLGLFEAMQAKPSQFPDAARRSLTAYRAATRTGYQVVVQLGEGEKLKIEAYETRPLPGSRFGLRSGLPEAVRKQADHVRDTVLIR
ncbi:MAG: hypothetical protein ACO1SV_25870 [Fimbriimonas sp.]